MRRAGIVDVLGILHDSCVLFFAPSPSPNYLSTISDRNQARRSVSSIQFSIRLALATSPCSSHNSWAGRRLRVSSGYQPEAPRAFPAAQRFPHCCPSSADSRNIANGLECGPADFARPFGSLVGHSENLLALFIKQE